MNNVIKQLHQHVSVRDYTDEIIHNADLEEILTAAQCAASSHFVQAYSVISIENKAKKAKLAALSKNSHVATCSIFLVFCADLARLNIACLENKKIIQSQLMENLLVSTIDTALFAQGVALAAESKGYGTCFIGGVRNNPDKICELLSIPSLVYPVFGMTLGIPSKINNSKPRLPLEAVLHKENYNSKKYGKLLKQYDEVMKDYYTSRNKDNNWSNGISQFMSQLNRPYMKEFLAKQLFKAE